MLPFQEGGAVEYVARETLSVGDYACRYRDGSSPPVRFERKGMGDLFGTMTTNYKRFKKEMNRATAEGIQLILAVEGSFTDVIAGWAHSQYSGDSMAKKLMTMQIRYKMDMVFCQSRFEMARYITEFYEAIGREKFRK